MRAIAAALVLFAAWTAATWFLEGRIATFLRPEAAIDRLTYAVIANLMIGIVGGMLILRLMLNWEWLRREAAGFGSPVRTAMALAAGLVLGLAFYALSGGPTANPVVITNVFAQVIVISAAEVIVCWAVVGSVLEAFISQPWASDRRGGGRRDRECVIRHLSLRAQPTVRHNGYGRVPKRHWALHQLVLFCLSRCLRHHRIPQFPRSSGGDKRARSEGSSSDHE